MDALLEIGRRLMADGYHFVTPTPLTHQRVMARGRPEKVGLRDIFGWNHSFAAEELPDGYWPLLAEGGLAAPSGENWRSRVRFSSLGGLLFAHSAFPTLEADSVFFGPDTYRFARAIAQILAERPGFRPVHIVDIGAGSGAGGLYGASLLPRRPQVTLVDINEKALDFAGVNAALNRIAAQAVHSDLLTEVRGWPDFIISNPPYLADRIHRTYRDGGGPWGFDLSARIVAEALDRLHEDGVFLLYTGAPVRGGEDLFLGAVRDLLGEAATGWRYEEIDPDVFGEELEQPPYDRAERIAAVMLFVEGRNIRR